MKNFKRSIIVSFLCIIVFLNGGCIKEQSDDSAPLIASFTNLTLETVLLYIDGKIDTQIFAQTTYRVELPAGHHKYAVLHKTTHEELMSGDISSGDCINIMP